MMNKLSSTILFSGLSALISLPGSVSQVLAQSSNFADIRGYWAEQYVTALSDRRIIGGFPDGSFKPNADITRAQFAAIAVKALDIPLTSSGRSFTDVRSNYWAAPAIGAVSNSGLVTGFPDGTFRPEERITRAQALVVLAKALGDRATADSAQLNRYSDRQSIPSWATESVAKAANANIIVNFPDSSRIAPNDLATRGEVAALMYQTLFKLGNRGLPLLAIGTIDSGNNNPNNNSPVASSLVIEKIETNANGRRPFTAGDDLTVTAFGTPNASASFRLEGLNQNESISMPEVQSGVYEGRYTIRRNDRQINSRLIVSMTRQGSATVAREFNRAIAINSDNQNSNNQNSNSNQTLRPEITNFRNNDAIDLPVDLLGETLADANVQVRVEILRSVIGIIDVSQTLSDTTVRANRQGRFRVQLPLSNAVSGTRYRIRLTATLNNQSQTNEIILRQN